MKLKTIYKTFVYAIVVIAYCVIIYKLATYDNYGTLFNQFVSNISTNWMYLVLCLLLMPCNMLTEAVKWQCAVRYIEKISFKKAIISTLRGQVGGIATPNKLGDIPTRALSLRDENKASGIVIGFIATWTLPLVSTILGTVAAIKYLSIYYPEILNNKPKALLIGSAIAIITLVILPFFLKKMNGNNRVSSKIRPIINAIANISFAQIGIFVTLSCIRYAIFCSQMFLMLRFFGIEISIAQALMVIPTIYALTTITPILPGTEAASRISYALLVLKPISQTCPTIALATSLLWALNCGIPIILGSFLFNKTKKYC